MSVREVLLLVGLLSASAAVARGVALVSEAAAWIVGGLALAVLTVLFTAETD